MSQPVEQSVPLDGLAALVRVERIQALLINRPPDCLTDPNSRPLVNETVRGIASEVTAITGRAPSEDVRELAVWAIVLGAAASLEAALFPEQQLGDSARADVLQRRYLGVLADLRRASTAGITGGAFSGVVHVARGGWPS